MYNLEKFNFDAHIDKLIDIFVKQLRIKQLHFIKNNTILFKFDCSD